MFPALRRSAIGAAALLCVAASTAAAQTEPPPRQSRGIFAGTRRSPQAADADAKAQQKRSRVELSTSLFGGYDSNVLARGGGQPGTGLDTRASAGGISSGLDTALLFVRDGERVSVSASGAAAVRYYPRLSDLTAVTYQGDIAFNAALSRTTRLSTVATAGYLPFFSFRAFPAIPDLSVAAQPAAADLDFAIEKREGRAYGGTLTLAQELGPRARLSAAYGERRRDFSGVAARNADTWSASGGLSWTLTRYASLRAGYSRQDSRGDAEGTRGGAAETIDLGIDYQRPLSRTRNTMLSFRSGASAIEQAGKRLRRIVGNASLRHDFGRTWQGRVDYRRGASFVDGFDEPFFSDGISADVGGFLSRRVEVKLSAGFSSGEAGVQVDAPRYDSYTGLAHVRIGLTRRIGAYTEARYYYYEFDSRVALPTGFPAKLDRYSVRVGISLWLPIRN